MLNFWDTACQKFIKITFRRFFEEKKNALWILIILRVNSFAGSSTHLLVTTLLVALDMTVQPVTLSHPYLQSRITTRGQPQSVVFVTLYYIHYISPLLIHNLYINLTLSSPCSSCPLDQDGLHSFSGLSCRFIPHPHNYQQYVVGPKLVLSLLVFLFCVIYFVSLH